MNSKEIYRLSITIICVIILIHYTSSQPVSDHSSEDDNLWLKSSSDSESNEESIPKYYFLKSEYNQINQPNLSELTRRANFWKRANFWRKRANFWRRDITP